MVQIEFNRCADAFTSERANKQSIGRMAGKMGNRDSFLKTYGSLNRVRSLRHPQLQTQNSVQCSFAASNVNLRYRRLSKCVSGEDKIPKRACAVLPHR